VQDVDARDLARVLRGMRERKVDGKPKPYSPWTQVAVYRIIAGTFALALRRGVIVRSPVDGLATSERPKQRNARQVAVLDAATLDSLIAAGSSARWRVALALAAHAGLRIGEVRGLRWGDLDLDGDVLHVRRSMLRDGTAKSTKTAAGERAVPLLPSLRSRLVEYRLASGCSADENYVVSTHKGAPVQERNLRRALDAAKSAAGLDATEDRLSWHSLRHSFASLMATDLDLPATTLAEIVGHADAGFTLRVYARDGRDTATVVADVLQRAASAGVGS
jgi:integrase